MKQNNKVIKTSSIFLKKKGKVLFLLVPFIVIHLFLTYGIEMIIVNGESMEPAYSHGDVVFVLKMPHSYEYGDVVVAVHDNYHVLKRVAGEPEDIVNINEAENIGDVKMPHTILKDSYFLLGDNRSISYDSRFSDFGDIHKDKIIGKVIYKLQRRTNLMDKKSLFIIDEKAMLENFEDKTPKNAFEFLYITKGIDIEYKVDKK